jgi:hypothetical protein
MNCNTIYVSNVINGEDSITLIPNRPIRTLENVGCYRLVICCNATADANLPINIQVNDVNIPVLCHAGNIVYSSQLRKRANYPIIYGNQNPGYVNGQFVIQDRICPRASQIPATVTRKNDK